MRKVLMSVALLSLVLATAVWAGPAEKPALNSNLQDRPVLIPQLDSRLALIDEGFEGAVPPDGWSVMTSGAASTWEQTSNPNSGAFSAGVLYGPQGAFQDEWLVTPALDASALSVMYLEFVENEDYWASYGLYHDIMISTTVGDDPAAFTSVWNMTPGTHTIDGWTPQFLDLSAYVGESTVYVAFRYQGDWADNWYVDDVRIYEPSEHDVAVAAVYPADLISLDGVEITPQVTVANVGLNAETFEVNLTMTYEGGAYLDETVTVYDLAPGEELVVDFTPFTTAFGIYTLAAEAILPSDEDPANNTGAGMVLVWGATRVPIQFLYTEWGCGPCVGANQALDTLYPTFGNDAALVRVHVSWPSGTDPMYHANEEQNDYLLGMTPFVVNAVPNPVMENIFDVWTIWTGDWSTTMPAAFDWSFAIPSPLTVDVQYNNVTGNVEVFTEVINALPAGNYRVFVAITEDNVYAPGPNGEEYHSQTFRWLFPGTEGIEAAMTTGLHFYDVPVELDSTWNFDELRAVAWVQRMDNGSGPILNSGTRFLHEGAVNNGEIGEEVPEDTPVMLTQVKGAYPNPFNPMTTIEMSVARTQHVNLSIYNMNGQFVTTLVNGTVQAGDHPVQWNGTDSQGRGVASGTYIVHMDSDDMVSAAKIMLVR